MVRKFETHKLYPQILVFYLACLSGMIIFAGVTYYLNQENGPLSDSSRQIWDWFAASIALVGVLSSDFVFSWLSKRIPKTGTWEYRCRLLRIAFLIRYILLELTAMVTGLAFIISGDIYSFVIMLLIIVYTILKWPFRESLIELSYASAEEKKLL